MAGKRRRLKNGPVLDAHKYLCAQADWQCLVLISSKNSRGPCVRERARDPTHRFAGAACPERPKWKELGAIDRRRLFLRFRLASSCIRENCHFLKNYKMVVVPGILGPVLVVY